MDAATALADVLTLTDIPFDHSGPDRTTLTIPIILRSTRTRREMLDAMSPARAARRLEEAEAYGEHLDAHDEIRWTITRPHPSSFFARMTFDEWIEWEAAKLPDGYLPIRRAEDPAEVIELRSAMQRYEAANNAAAEAERHRDDIIRRCLAAGMSVVRVMAVTGLSKPRIYQIRDGRR
jgi:hypothetical protein